MGCQGLEFSLLLGLCKFRASLKLQSLRQLKAQVLLPHELLALHHSFYSSDLGKADSSISSLLHPEIPTAAAASTERPEDGRRRGVREAASQPEGPGRTVELSATAQAERANAEPCVCHRGHRAHGFASGSLENSCSFKGCSLVCIP